MAETAFFKIISLLYVFVGGGVVFCHSRKWLDVGSQFPDQGLNPTAAVKVLSSNHETTRELPRCIVQMEEIWTGIDAKVKRKCERESWFYITRG